MKNKSSKKVIAAVSKLVAGTARTAYAAEKKGGELFARVAEKWDATKPERRRVANAVRNVIKKAEKNTDAAIAKTVQIKNDIATGVKQGIKKAQL